VSGFLPRIRPFGLNLERYKWMLPSRLRQRFHCAGGSGQSTSVNIKMMITMRNSINRLGQPLFVTCTSTFPSIAIT
jgi:hypothetical protein